MDKDNNTPELACCVPSQLFIVAAMSIRAFWKRPVQERVSCHRDGTFISSCTVHYILTAHCLRSRDYITVHCQPFTVWRSHHVTSSRHAPLTAPAFWQQLVRGRRGFESCACAMATCIIRYLFVVLRCSLLAPILENAAYFKHQNGLAPAIA